MAPVRKYRGLVVYGLRTRRRRVYDPSVPDASILDQLAQPIEAPPPRRVGVMKHNISFRCTDEQMVAAEAFRSTFPSGTWAEAFQWFLSAGPGRELIAKRVRGEI